MTAAQTSAETPATPILILVAHGARDPLWAAPLQRIAEVVRAQAPLQRVRTAFLGMLAPSLEECIAEAIDRGEQDFLIVPVFIAEGGHLKRDLPDRLVALRAQYPQACFTQERALGEAESVVQAMAAHALAQLQRAS
ncbi:sirohydrochlorin chelatase [Rhodocyclus tenuis]|uniref:sirohydrochlorin chelatase n=1 Tax=Rhodocyclus tenuis TaxID=1066 RepID=UPI001908B097|nr:CbiX/SirB N-terminal domain-containing protein [Rhodocyclus tenuis]MBK1679937.1 hypothetical protein [Rhodocyclus tenuis]